MRLCLFAFRVAVLAAVPWMSACGGGDTGSDAAPTMTTVNVALADFTITPDQTTVPAGLVTFVATNNGSMIHEMVVARTDLAPGALPTMADGSVDEAMLDSPGEVSELDPAGTGMVTLDLAAGSYVLFCNVVMDNPPAAPVSHYALGMYLAFTVQ
jgi:uncharacterized cupredoxin-like copper-binding protein